jgi:hypothetical protein
MAMRYLGRALQISGLTILPLSMLLQLMQTIDVKTMLLMLVMGFAGFYLGRIVEGYGAAP